MPEPLKVRVLGPNLYERVLLMSRVPAVGEMVDVKMAQTLKPSPVHDCLRVNWVIHHTAEDPGKGLTIYFDFVATIEVYRP